MGPILLLEGLLGPPWGQNRDWAQTQQIKTGGPGPPWPPWRYALFLTKQFFPLNKNSIPLQFPACVFMIDYTSVIISRICSQRVGYFFWGGGYIYWDPRSAYRNNPAVRYLLSVVELRGGGRGGAGFRESWNSPPETSNVRGSRGLTAPEICLVTLAYQCYRCKKLLW